MFRFVKGMIAFRKAHPGIGRSRFWRDDVSWFGADGPVDLKSTQLAYWLRGASEGDVDLYVMINGGPDAVTFRVRAEAGTTWLRAVDTSATEPHDVVVGRPTEEMTRADLRIEARSVVVLVSDGLPRQPRQQVAEFARVEPENEHRSNLPAEPPAGPTAPRSTHVPPQ